MDTKNLGNFLRCMTEGCFPGWKARTNGAVPEMIKSLMSIHHNDIVSVQLNEAGLNEFERQMIEFRATLPLDQREEISLSPKNLDRSGRVRFPFWLFMALFGGLMQFGSMPPWDGEIVMEIERSDGDC